MILFSTIQIITAAQITSLSQQWVEQPGAKAEVYVESQSEDGQLCEDHLRLRIMLQYGDTDLTLLPIWVIMNCLLMIANVWHFYFTTIVDEKAFT